MKTVMLMLTFPDSSSDENASDVADIIASGIASDLQAIHNGGMSTEEAFGPGAIAPITIHVNAARPTASSKS